MKKTISLVLVLVLGMAVEVANADFAIGTPTNLGPTVNSQALDIHPGITADGLSLYFTSDRPGGYGDLDLWVTTRGSISDPWTTPVNLGATVNTWYAARSDSSPSLSADGLELYFESDRGGISSSGSSDLWLSIRATTEDPWGEPRNLGRQVNSAYTEYSPAISTDRLCLFFHGWRPNDTKTEIFMTTRDTTADAWGIPVKLGPNVNTWDQELGPEILPNGLILFFASDRPGGYGGYDLWMTRRATVDGDWRTPVNLGPTVNSSSGDGTTTVCAEGSTLYFDSDRPGGYGDSDLWQAPIEAIVDLNGDEVVDSADMCIMVDHWGEYYSLCDIGPTPLGDGIVDVQDLIVLAEHLFEDTRAIAHWQLDEQGGDAAYDSAGEYDGALHGQPVWRPTGGRVRGALQLDGVDDYISTPFVLNPGNSALSICVWVMAEAPGQVIIAQADTPFDTPQGPVNVPGSMWLGTDPLDGGLMTGLMEAAAGQLESDALIADGQWHHIALVYDRTGMKRHLYVDGAEVAADSDSVSRVQGIGGLYFGAGQTLDAASFFSGLIDDIRIYPQVLSAEEIAALAE